MERRTIRDINISKNKSSKEKKTSKRSSSKKRSRKQAGSTEKQGDSGGPTIQARTSKGRGGYTSTYKEHNRSYAGWWFLLILVVIAIAMVVWTLLGRVTLGITPERASVEVDTMFEAYKDTNGGGELSYQVMQFSDVLSATSQVSEMEEVTKKASGSITVYNEESEPQTLIEETRFESSEGLIYKTPKGVRTTVPAAQGSTPGTTTVTVYANEPGEEYNIGRDDFVIPGWREIDSPKFKTQYARTKTAIAGGFVGMRPATNAKELQNTKEQLRQRLSRRMSEEALAQTPKEYVLFDDAYSITYATPDLQLPATDSNNIHVEQQATLTAVLFKEDALSDALARRAIEEYDDETQVVVTNLDDLSVTVEGDYEKAVKNSPQVMLSIDGTAMLEWLVPVDSLVRELTGTPKKEFQSHIQEYSSIASAELTTKPFWLLTIPEEPNRFSVYKENTEITKNCAYKSAMEHRCWITELDF